MSVSYRKLLPEHTRQYRDLRLESLKQHPEHFGSRYEEQVKLPELGLEPIIKKQDAEWFVIGAFAGEELIGICAFVPHNEFNLDQTGILIQMYVKEAFSGQKIGLGLTQALVTEALKLPDISQVMLEVNPKNAKAVHVYEQAGFERFTPTTAKPKNLGQGDFMIFRDASLLHKP